MTEKKAECLPNPTFFSACAHKKGIFPSLLCVRWGQWNVERSEANHIQALSLKLSTWSSTLSLSPAGQLSGCRGFWEG